MGFDGGKKEVDRYQNMGGGGDDLIISERSRWQVPQCLVLYCCLPEFFVTVEFSGDHEVSEGDRIEDFDTVVLKNETGYQGLRKRVAYSVLVQFQKFSLQFLQWIYHYNLVVSNVLLDQTLASWNKRKYTF